MKAEVDKLNINKLVKVPIILNNLKTKAEDFDVGRLETISLDLKNWFMQSINRFLKTQNLTY